MVAVLLTRDIIKNKASSLYTKMQRQEQTFDGIKNIKENAASSQMLGLLTRNNEGLAIDPISPLALQVYNVKTD